MEDHWKKFSDILEKLLARMPGFDPDGLEADSQDRFAAYTPPPGLWTDQDKKMHAHFSAIDTRVFHTLMAECFSRRLAQRTFK
jgi:hypothetical protein